MDDEEFEEGDHVHKKVGDYSFAGIVVARFQKVDMRTGKKSNEVRYVVQNYDGILHIFSAKQLRRAAFST